MTAPLQIDDQPLDIAQYFAMAPKEEALLLLSIAKVGVTFQGRSVSVPGFDGTLPFRQVVQRMDEIYRSAIKPMVDLAPTRQLTPKEEEAIRPIWDWKHKVDAKLGQLFEESKEAVKKLGASDTTKKIPYEFNPLNACLPMAQDKALFEKMVKARVENELAKPLIVAQKAAAAA